MGPCTTSTWWTRSASSRGGDSTDSPRGLGQFFAQFREKKLKNLIQAGSGAFGNAATRIETLVAAGGAYVYGSYPDIDGLFREQSSDTDRKRREATLQRIQRLMHDKAIVVPSWELAFLNGVGSRVAESGLGLMPAWPRSGKPFGMEGAGSGDPPKGPSSRARTP